MYKFPKIKATTTTRSLGGGVTLTSTKFHYTEPRTRKGFVYLIQSPTGAYKIGRTVDPADRLKTFAVKLPFEVEYLVLLGTDDMYKLETRLHRKFKKQRINGEWFKLSYEDIKYIEQVGAEDDLDDFLESMGID
jgi:hypothetical protein